MAELPASARRHLAAATSAQAQHTTLPAIYDQLNASGRRRVREAYVERQRGKCAHCGERLSDPAPVSVTRAWINWALFPGGEEGFLRHPVHLHHDHKTGLTIGAIHAYCNAWLWQYKRE